MNKLLIILPIVSILIVGSVLQFNGALYTHLRSTGIADTVSIEEWLNCATPLEDLQPCQNIDEYHLAEKQFNDVLTILTQTPTNPCNSFSAYYKRSQPNQPINKNGDFEKCFLSSEILSVANSNSCFKTNYFEPKYFQCAGL